MWPRWRCCENQQAGRADQAQAWRVLITLPQFANADDGGLLLHQPGAEARQPGVSQALAKEYISWQVSRVRQLMDRLQHAIADDDVNDAYLAGQSLGNPDTQPIPALAPGGRRAERPRRASGPAAPVLAQPYASGASVAQLAAWRVKLEGTLPNLLKPEDVTRLQRLLVRFVTVIPKEYRNGVDKPGSILIPLEYQEAAQFTEQAQGLVNELSPVWQRDLAGPYAAYHGELVSKLAGSGREDLPYRGCPGHRGRGQGGRQPAPG